MLMDKMERLLEATRDAHPYTIFNDDDNDDDSNDDPVMALQREQERAQNLLSVRTYYIYSQ